MSVAVAVKPSVSQRAHSAARSLAAAAGLAAPLAVLIYLLLHPEADRLFESHVAHFYVVTFVSLVGFVIAAAVMAGGGRLRDARAFFLNLGFQSIAGIFLVHALTTPGVLIGMNPMVGLAARLSLFAGSVAFALSTVRWSARVNAWIAARWRILLALLAVLWAVFALTSLLAPGVVARPLQRMGSPAPEARPPGPAAIQDVHGYGGYDGTISDRRSSAVPAAGPTLDLRSSAAPAAETPAAPFAAGLPPAAFSSSTLMAIAAVVLFTLAAWRYFGEYRVTAHPTQGTLVVGTVLLAEAQLAMWLSPTWALSWWEYHGLMLAGFLASVLGFGLTYARHGSVAGVLETLFLTDTVARIEASYSDAIFALVAAVEARDRYTKGHSSRVSQMAVLIGEAMRLPGSTLRSLGRCGLIHDVGKLAVPDAILSKPGRLTPEEYEVVKQHPVRGFEVIRRVSSLRDELPGVLYHHEWYDGSGYPHGLRGEAIPLAARILAVADVYDALTSDRPYRTALGEDQAVTHLRLMAGTQFDPRVVQVFQRIEPAWRERRQRLAG